jgi:peptide/nickel transport system substrate-binding protein
MTTFDSAFSRREMLKYAASGTVVLTGADLVAACGASKKPTTTVITGKPKLGGTLRAGLSGGASSDTLDPHNWVNLVDGSRVYQLFNSLVEFDANALPKLSLAEELTPSPDAMSWTIRVKPDVTFHNGKTLTADDVVFTFQRITNSKKPALGAISLKALDIARIKKLDSRTVRIPCITPFAALPSILASYDFFVLPVGFDLKNPVGTGPFKYVSFTPGQQSVFARNENYWETGLPYLDQVVISDYADETSQVNGLLGGSVDVIDLLSSSSIAPLQSGGAGVIITNGGGYTPFTMRVDQPPFNDVRVRQAMRMICNRQQMLNVIFGGHGKIGNDVFGVYDPLYDTSLPQRQQDIEQAKSLLKQAGHEGLTVTLVTSAIGTGTVKVAQVFAQQAKAAGVTVNLNDITSSDFFGPNYLSWTFAQDYWNYYPYFSNVLQGTLAGAPFNECHVNNSKYTTLYKQAVATLDPTKQRELAWEMQTMEYDGTASGYIIPYFPPIIDGHSSRLRGVTSSKTGLPLGGFDFKHFWFA